MVSNVLSCFFLHRTEQTTCCIDVYVSITFCFYKLNLVYFVLCLVVQSELKKLIYLYISMNFLPTWVGEVLSKNHVMTKKKTKLLVHNFRNSPPNRTRFMQQSIFWPKSIKNTIFKYFFLRKNWMWILWELCECQNVFILEWQTGT